MEAVHGVDVRWMNYSARCHTARKEKPPSEPPAQNGTTEESPAGQEQAPADKAKTVDGLARSISEPTPPTSRHDQSTPEKQPPTSVGSKTGTSPGHSPTTPRRSSWLTSLSSRFSSQTHHQHGNVSDKSPATSPSDAHPPDTPFLTRSVSQQEEPERRPAGPSAPRNAVLPHAVKPEGDRPYVPAPPKGTSPGFLSNALRRLSSGGNMHAASGRDGVAGHAGRKVEGGLCERKVMNVCKDRERSRIPNLKEGKLRRVAFCVDVEITSTPKYADDDEDDELHEPGPMTVHETTKKKMELAEGAAMQGETPSSEDGAAVEHVDAPKQVDEPALEEDADGKDAAEEKDSTKKKEKKKRSEAERKARKEKKRQLAEANGIIPVELRDSSDASDTGLATGAPQTNATLDPARIYRRCCQLRESPILKKITEQLASTPTVGVDAGVVTKLDLSNSNLQHADIMTLADCMAVVPIKEVNLENCGLNDESVRIILAALLAAKIPLPQRRRRQAKPSKSHPGGVVEQLTLKNNPRIGKEGWKYICLFINMCHSLTAIDLSQIPFPNTLVFDPPDTRTSLTKQKEQVAATTAADVKYVSCLLSMCLSERVASDRLRLINLGECNITALQLKSLVSGAIKSGLRCLGLAGNNITTEGMEQVGRLVREGKIEGLDISGNDLQDQLGVIADALDEENPLFALSIADCKLSPASLWTLFPALVNLKNFRFIDLSHNHQLFDASPTALPLLRRLEVLKRIHLMDVNLSSEQVIALAEILPESPSIAHINILENPQIEALADAKDEATQEEACAVFASLLAAARVSSMICCIDVDVPTAQSSEIVKALAKQVVAYCLYNMERGPVAELSAATPTTSSDSYNIDKAVAVPDVLLDLVGHIEGVDENQDQAPPAPDEDYVIGGTGVVKALGVCLRNKGNEKRPSSASKRTSIDGGESGSLTPRASLAPDKAKEMSKNLLGSARKIRARLQPALLQESKDHTSRGLRYHRLQFLDNTLAGMIMRFEDEFPETRIATSAPPMQSSSLASAALSPITHIGTPSQRRGDDASDADGGIAEDDASLPLYDDPDMPPRLSRHGSDVSIASRALGQEEGRMHRFGQKVRRDIIKPLDDATDGDTTWIEGTSLSTPLPTRSASTVSSLHPPPPSSSTTTITASNPTSTSHLTPTSTSSSSPPHPPRPPTAAEHAAKGAEVAYLRAMLHEVQGDEILRYIQDLGEARVYAELSNEASDLRRRLRDAHDPRVWACFVESQRMAQRNAVVGRAEGEEGGSGESGEGRREAGDGER